MLILMVCFLFGLILPVRIWSLRGHHVHFFSVSLYNVWSINALLSSKRLWRKPSLHVSFLWCLCRSGQGNSTQMQKVISTYEKWQGLLAQTWANFLGRSKDILLGGNWDIRDLGQVERCRWGPEKCDKVQAVVGRAWRREQEPWASC